jgi:hypothetical protein
MKKYARSYRNFNYVLYKEFYEKFKNIDFKYLEEVKDNDRFYELH